MNIEYHSNLIKKIILAIAEVLKSSPGYTTEYLDIAHK